MNITETQGTETQGTLADLSRLLADVKANIATKRQQIAEKQATLSVVEKNQIPRSELGKRFCADVDMRAARFARVPPPGQKWTPASEVFRALGNPDGPPGHVEIQSPDDLFNVLCFLAGDALKAGAPKLLTIDGWTDGLPAKERAETIARLKREIAEDGAAEEQEVDAANEAGKDAGVHIEHRPEVIARRKREAADCENLAKSTAAAKARMAAGNQRVATTRRVQCSEYLVPFFANRHAS